MKNKIKFGLFLYVVFSILDLHTSYAAQDPVDEAASTLNTNLWIFTDVFSLGTVMNIIFAIVVFIVTFLLSKTVPKLISVRIEKHMWNIGGSAEEMVSIVNRTLAVIISIIGFSAALTILWIDMTIFMGGVWFGIWFTLRVFLTNFITGIIMVTQGTYHNGDLIEIEGKMGKIKKIYALYTAVEQFNGVVYFVPNVKFLEENVSNYYSNDKRRIDVEVVVNYDTDVYKAKNLMVQVAGQFPNLLKTPAPEVIVEELGENGVLLTLRAWMNSDGTYIKTKSNITETVNLAFKKSGITIPYKNITLIEQKKPKGEAEKI